MKQSRQSKRQEVRQSKKQNESMRKNLTKALTKKEILPLVQAVTDIQKDLAASFSLLNAITHWMNKTDTRKKEFEKCINWVDSRNNTVKQINEGKGNYKDRIILCKKCGIDFKETIIAQQITNDTDLTQEEKESY